MNYLAVVRIDGGTPSQASPCCGTPRISRREARCYVNLASLTIELGDVVAGAVLHREGPEETHRYGPGGFDPLARRRVRDRWLPAG